MARICSCAAHYFGIFCFTVAVLFNLHLRAGDGASAASLKVCYFFFYFSVFRGSLKKKKLDVEAKAQHWSSVFFCYINCVSFALALTRRPLYPAHSEVDKLSLQLDFSVQVIIFCFPFASHLKLLFLNRLTSP